MAATLLKLKTQAVIRKSNIRWQFAADGLVIQFVRQVRQVRTLRLELGDHVERLLHSEMRRVRAVSQGVEDQHLETLQQRQAAFGDAVDVGAVGDAVDAETEYAELRVHQR